MYAYTGVTRVNRGDLLGTESPVITFYAFAHPLQESETVKLVGSACRGWTNSHPADISMRCMTVLYRGKKSSQYYQQQRHRKSDPEQPGIAARF